MEAFDGVAEALFNKQLSGQKDIQIQTKSPILTCRRATGEKVNANQIVAGNASVQFPEMKDFFGSGVVDIQVRDQITSSVAI